MAALRILVLNWKDPAHPEAGGAERYVRRVAECWAAAGHAVTLLVPRYRDQPAEEMIGGVRHWRAGNRLTVFPLARRRLRRTAREWDHVVESVSTRPFLAHRVVGARATAVYMQTATDVWAQEMRFPLSVAGRWLVEPRWIRGMRDARVVAISASTAADLRGHGVPVTGIVPPGWEAVPPRPRAAMPEPPRLLFVGRLSRTKRPGEALRAFSLLRARCPQATLDVVGDGYLAGALRREAVPGVSWHGRTDEATKRALLGRASLVLLPGTREGWGIVAMEAAGHGVPVVAYDIPGFRDAVVDGETGLLCAPRPEAMAAAAADLLADPARWLALSRRGLDRAQRFTWERTAAGLLDLVAGAGKVDDAA